MLNPDDELEQACFALPSSVRAAMRCHARHQRERPYQASVEREVCGEPGCVRYRERAMMMDDGHLHAKVSGPQMLSHLLKVSAREAGAIMIDGLRDEVQMAAIQALLDGVLSAKPDDDPREDFRARREKSKDSSVLIVGKCAAAIRARVPFS